MLFTSMLLLDYKCQIALKPTAFYKMINPFAPPGASRSPMDLTRQNREVRCLIGNSEMSKENSVVPRFVSVSDGKLLECNG